MENETGPARSRKLLPLVWVWGGDLNENVRSPNLKAPGQSSCREKRRCFALGKISSHLKALALNLGEFLEGIHSIRRLTGSRDRMAVKLEILFPVFHLYNLTTG